MASGKSGPNQDSLSRIMAQVRQNKGGGEDTYRERALKLFPWVCAKCGREFSGKRPEAS